MGSSKNPYAFNLYAWIRRDVSLGISIRMVPQESYMYMAADTKEADPQNVKKDEYRIRVGSTVNEVEEYICNRIQNFITLYGKPKGKAHYFTQKSLDMNEKIDIITKMIKNMDWNQGL